MANSTFAWLVVVTALWVAYCGGSTYEDQSAPTTATEPTTVALSTTLHAPTPGPSSSRVANTTWPATRAFRTHTRSLPALTAPPTTPAPPRPNKTKSVAIAIETVIPATAATLVETASLVAVIAAAAASPGIATKASNLANIVGITDCTFSDSSLDPPWTEVMIPVDIGSSRTAALLGGIVTTLSLTLLMYILDLLLTAVAKGTRRLRRVVAVASFAVAGYMLPSTTKYAVTMIRHGVDGKDAFVGFLAVFITALLILVPAAIMHVQISRHFGSLKMLSARPLAMSWAFPFVIAAEGCVDTSSVSRRHMFTEDIFVAVCIGAISGVQPNEDYCNQIGYAILAFTSAHLLYSVILRPLDSTVETAFAIAIAFGQEFAAIAAIVALNREGMLGLLGMLSLVQYSLFVIQTVVLAIAAIANRLRKTKMVAAALDRRRVEQIAELERRLMLEKTAKLTVDPGMSWGGNMSPQQSNRVLLGKADEDTGVPIDIHDASTANPLIDPQFRPRPRPHGTQDAMSQAIAMATSGGMVINGPLQLPPHLRTGDLAYVDSEDDGGFSLGMRNDLAKWRQVKQDELLVSPHQSVSLLRSEAGTARSWSPSVSQLMAATVWDPMKSGPTRDQSLTATLVSAQRQFGAESALRGGVRRPANPLGDFL
jgi:hypothetical protein